MSAKDIIGNRTQLTKWQDDFFAHMVKNFPDLERGESASVTGRRHIPTRVFKQAIRLSKQAKQIQTSLESISPLNVGKKKVEIADMLHKFFPAMERLETQFQKYKRELAALEQENAVLEKRLDDSTPGIKEQLNAARQQQEIQFLRQFHASIPEEYKEAYRAAQQRHAPTKQR